MTYCIIALILCIITGCILRLKLSNKKKLVFIILSTSLVLILAFYIPTLIPKSLTIDNNDGTTYIATDLGTTVLNDEEKKSQLISIINSLTLYKGDKHHGDGYQIKDLKMMNIVSDNMKLSSKKVQIAFFYLQEGEDYGTVSIDNQAYYFKQGELYNALITK